MEMEVELQVLQDISTIVDESEDIKGILTPILIAISKHTPMIRGAITLLNRDTKEILIESAYGFTDAQKKKGRYNIGEGITGNVVKSGQVIIIPDISKDDRYINKTGAQDDLNTLTTCISLHQCPNSKWKRCYWNIKWSI